MKVPYIAKELLEKYLAGTCTLEERQRVDAWFHSISGTPDYLESLSEQELNKFKKDNLSKIQKTIQRQAPKPKRKIAALTLGIAAAASIVLCLALAYWPPSSTTKNKASSYPVVSASADMADWIRYTNNENKIISHLLPDGSTIWLHPKAQIQYPERFDLVSRKVIFDGEGFFDIQRNTSCPFLIQAGTMQIRVLGTSFNVKAGEHDKIYEVAVVTGQVAIGGAGHHADAKEIKINPSEQAFFEPSSEKITRIKVSDQHKKEIFEPVSIVFDNCTLREAIDQLERRFDVKVHLLNPGMYDCRITADFEQQPLMMILEMLCTNLGASYNLSGKNILLEGPSCNI